MSKNVLQRGIAFGFAALLTLVTLGGIDQLSLHSDGAVDWEQPTHRV